MKAVKKVLTLLLILTIISQIFIPSNVEAQNTIRTYDSNSLYDEVAKNAVLDNIRSKYVDSDTGIDFTKGASSTNGQGVYTIASTKDDLYPIHYYRGNIDNNNVLFGGFCWQIVRTTETGGVKLIYNGSSDKNGKCESPEKDWKLQIENDKNISYMYGIDVDSLIKFIDNRNWYELAENLSENIYVGVESNISNIDFYYSEEVEYSEDTGYTLKNAQHHNRGDSIENLKTITPLYYCDGVLENCSEVRLILLDTYEEDYDDVYYLELSNGFTYEDVKKINLVFSNDVEYKDGHYELKNIINIPLMSVNAEENIKKVLGGHHYFCDDFNNSCNEVNYIYSYDDYELNYLTFADGDKADDIYNEFKNSTNKNDSELKNVIDKWYSENLIDNTEYLEDTIWCNDRSKIGEPYNKNNTITEELISGDSHGGGGYYYGDISLSLNCVNKNDEFTVNSKNGNGKLTYPTATITLQEAIYAGSPFENIDNNKLRVRKPYSYLNRYNRSIYTMTPMDIRTGVYLIEGDTITFDSFSCKSISGSCYIDSGAFPMISLKHSMVVSSGDGTPSNPYEVVEGNTVEYVIDGESPNGFLPPEVESYLKGSKVKMNGLKAGDIVNGYRFLGWQTKDVEVVDGAFDMPDNKVVFVGRFEKIEDSPLTYDSISKYITTGIIGVVGLFGLVLLKKKY